MRKALDERRRTPTHPPGEAHRVPAGRRRRAVFRFAKRRQHPRSFARARLRTGRLPRECVRGPPRPRPPCGVRLRTNRQVASDPVVSGARSGRGVVLQAVRFARNAPPRPRQLRAAGLDDRSRHSSLAARFLSRRAQRLPRRPAGFALCPQRLVRLRLRAAEKGSRGAADSGGQRRLHAGTRHAPAKRFRLAQPPH
ncbi:MAG: hypothetical protein BWZ10_00045 [candidate division BRC1 bacterium ADurb.BinA364]|nr:MAG: hypothetical protein BWZ10_00045 [candidate division BRC1 bacterium ADurb.BinA364]